MTTPARSSEPSPEQRTIDMGTYIATLLVGTVLSIPQGQIPQVATAGGVYDSNRPVIAGLGTQCHLQSYMQNGQVITVQVCQ